MIEWDRFAGLLGRFVGGAVVTRDDTLFGSGLDISSIAYTEFILELEEEYDLDIDVDGLDASITTAGQLYDRIAGLAKIESMDGQD